VTYKNLLRNSQPWGLRLRPMRRWHGVVNPAQRLN